MPESLTADKVWVSGLCEVWKVLLKPKLCVDKSTLKPLKQKPFLTTMGLQLRKA